MPQTCQICSKRFNKSTFAHAWHTRDANPDRVAGVGETLLNHGLCLVEMLGIGALYQRDGLTENDTVVSQDALDIIFHFHSAACRLLALEIGVDLCGLLNALMNR